MKRILNITNGDSTVALMKEAHISGEYLPWRDVLHDGPVPAKLSLTELSKLRAQFIADCGWGDPVHLQHGFMERDTKLRSCNEYDKILLWFEHDLYDQLQIIQILDWFIRHPVDNNIELSMICTDRYLGMLTSEELTSLYKYEKPVTKSQHNLASKSWEAFRSPTPEQLCRLLEIDTAELPFLQRAIIRLLEEFPNKVNGLSRTAHQALTIILDGENNPGRIFGENQKLEERIFMGDASFWLILNDLLQSESPLITSSGKKEIIPDDTGQQLSITEAGREVLDGKANWLDIKKPDKWIGGVHLTAQNLWCWDRVSRECVKRHKGSSE